MFVIFHSHSIIHNNKVNQSRQRQGRDTTKRYQNTKKKKGQSQADHDPSRIYQRQNKRLHLSFFFHVAIAGREIFHIFPRIGVILLERLWQDFVPVAFCFSGYHYTLLARNIQNVNGTYSFMLIRDLVKCKVHCHTNIYWRRIVM